LIRHFTLLACLLVLQGCRLVLVVPEGGTLQTASGAFSCPASSRCEIDISAASFDETFTAVASTGYRFTGWRQERGYFCGGTTEACRVFSLGFDADLEFYLQPEFERTFTASTDELIVLETFDAADTGPNLFDLNNASLLFTPSGDGYVASMETLSWEDEPGEEVAPGVVPVSASGFPFAGNDWTEVYFSELGMLTFGGENAALENFLDDFFLRFGQLRDLGPRLEAAPTIAILFRPVNWFASLYVAQRADRTVFTWAGSDWWGGALDILGAPNRLEMQATLFADGRIRLSYRDLDVRDGIVGVFRSSAGTAARGDASPASRSLYKGPMRQRHPDLMRPQAYLQRVNPSNSTLNDPVDLSTGEQPGGDSHYEAFHYRAPPAPAELACRAIQAQGDQFDFLVWYSQYRIDQQEAGTPINTPIGDFAELETGLGLTGSFPSGEYCSDGTLDGAYLFPVFIDAQTGRPDGNSGVTSDFFNNAVALLAHEIGHRWMAYVNAQVDGQRISLSDGIHWRTEVHMPSLHPWQGERQASPMGGSYWQDNGDGTFTQFDDAFLSPATGYSALDLYLMGLLSAEEVPDFFVLQGLEFLTRDAEGNPIYRGERVDVSIEDVIAESGQRMPSVEAAPRTFNTGFVYLVPAGEDVNEGWLIRLAAMRDRFIEYWQHVTGGRSTMQSTFNPQQ